MWNNTSFLGIDIHKHNIIHVDLERERDNGHEISQFLCCPFGRSSGSELWRRRTSSSDPAQRQGLVL